MLKKNFLAMPLEDLAHCHDGAGILRHTGVFGALDFQAPVRFVNYTILPPGTTIGLHRHENNQEMYIILDGDGVMEVDGERETVTTGDIIVNRPFGTHALYNFSDRDIHILVIEVGEAGV